MPDHLDIPKTHKLFIAGAFPRSESGRSLPITTRRGTVHISCASRKDLRSAVEAARAAFPTWRSATAYNRGQILYRMAEMLEGRRQEFIDLLRAAPAAKGRGITPRAAGLEVDAAIDRLVCFGGWADKYAQVLGCNNPVSGPYYNFTVPEPTGVVGVIAPDRPALLGLVSLVAPPLCAGNTIVALASETGPLPAVILGEVCATSDVPAGVVNLLTGLRDELVPQFASHRDLNALSASGISADEARTLREGAADNLKRITIGSILPAGRSARTGGATEPNLGSSAQDSPWTIEPFVEFKTVWHPSSA
jgi:acyl-CoA reductase-like NAD-dependent aldehyde dehydrogenase